MLYQKTIYVDKKKVAIYEELISREEIDFHKEDIPEDSTLFCATAVFDDGKEMDVKLCSGQTNCFMDAVLFERNGSEICCTSDVDSFLGEYWLNSDGNDYIVTFSST